MAWTRGGILRNEIVRPILHVSREDTFSNPVRTNFCDESLGDQDNQVMLHGLAARAGAVSRLGRGRVYTEYIYDDN